MAITKKISYRGDSSIATLNGNIRLEQASERIVVHDATTGGELNVVDGEGIKTFDPDSIKEIARNGRQPDDSINVAVANPGNSIQDAITP